MRPRNHTFGAEYARWILPLLLVLLSGALWGCGEDEPPPSGYFLAGAIVDGESLEAVDGAEVTARFGGDAVSTRADADGQYILGPIPVGTNYLLQVRTETHRPLDYAALPLPALSYDGETRTLLRDAHLYRADATAPELRVSIHPANPADRLPSTGSVQLTPMNIGLDPSLEATSSGLYGSTLVSGGYVQPSQSTLPNERGVQASPLVVPITDGEATLAAGSLSHGTTYRVVIDEVRGFEPTFFTLTAVRGGEVRVHLRRQAEQNTTSGAGAGTSAAGEQYYTGRIYDGVRLERINDYTIRLEYFDQVIHGQVDPTGRYIVGPLRPDVDYSIVIEAEGYRPLLSHNRRIGRGDFPDFVSLYYDAFLYPEDIASPQVKFQFRLGDSDDLPSGIVRLAPTGGSSLFDEEDEQPAGVDNQVWTNDEDLQHRSVTAEFTDGEVVFEEGDLTLGVNYKVTVFGVDGYGITEGGNYQAGVDNDPTIVMSPLNTAPLEIIYNSAQLSEPAADGRVTLRFNQPIRLSPAISLPTMQRALNDNLMIFSPDSDNDDMRNMLNPTDPTAAQPTYRGADLQVSDNTLVLTWDASQALETTDPDDPIYELSYGGLSTLRIESAIAGDSPSRTLAQLLGSSWLDVTITAQ